MIDWLNAQLIGVLEACIELASIIATYLRAMHNEVLIELLSDENLVRVKPCSNIGASAAASHSKVQLLTTKRHKDLQH